MISVVEAEAAIFAQMPEASVHEMDLNTFRAGVLREALLADRPLPPFDRVAMDGIAIPFDAWQSGRTHFQVEGIQQAGQAQLTLQNASACLEVMTGAILPAGCDCVIRVEDLSFVKGEALLAQGLELKRFQNIHRKGSDAPQDAVLVASGALLEPQILAIAASVGQTKLQVSALPKIALISTGDELVPPEQTPLPHQIRSSNQTFFAAALQQAGLAEIQSLHLPDEPKALLSGLAQALDSADHLILSGGVSMGKFDLVPQVLAELGVKEIFHKIRQRPGKPMWFGRSEKGQLVFGLPGNPVSSAVCLTRYVIPALCHSLGRQPLKRSAVLTQEIQFNKPMTYFVPVEVFQNQAAQVCARPVVNNGSGDFASLAGSAGFLELPETSDLFQVGEIYPLWLWSL